MKTASIREFRTNAEELLDAVEKDQDILIISRQRKEPFVILPISQYESLQETLHLCSTVANTENLMQSIAQHKFGKA